jgi:16S rRNA (guanine1207-N2)-methyltransferase
MSDPRISLALTAPGALPEAGRILVLGPRAETDLNDLPRERLVLVQGFAPDHARLTAQGYTVVPALGDEADFAAALVFLPRAKAEGRALVATAAARCRPGAPIWIDGGKTDGVDSILKDLRARADVIGPVGEPFSKAHGKIFQITPPSGAVLADWQAQAFEPAPGFMTLPGVFSAEGVDRGSALLAAALPAKLPGRVADLGAGWGWLSAQILARAGVDHLDLVEADHTALDCARRNITDPRAAFHWADATGWLPEARYGAVVMNPPFHVARVAEPQLGAAFIRAAGAMLSLSGTLYMVANRHLPYEPVLRQHFHEVEELGRDPGFKLFRAAKPIVGAGKVAPVAAAKPQRRRASRVGR